MSKKMKEVIAMLGISGLGALAVSLLTVLLEKWLGVNFSLVCFSMCILWGVIVGWYLCDQEWND